MATKRNQILQIEPSHELIINCSSNVTSTGQVRLLNPTHRRVCFKITTTPPERFSMQRRYGVVSPKAFVDVAATFRGTLEVMMKEYQNIKLIIQSAYVPDGEASADVDNIWTKLAPSDVTMSELAIVLKKEERKKTAVKRVPSKSTSVLSPARERRKDKCFRCESSFSLFSRKIYCGFCSEIFCKKCVGRYEFLPSDRPLCDMCYHRYMSQLLEERKPSTRTNPAEKAPAETVAAQSSYYQTDASRKPNDDETQLALAISQSAAEEKERQRQLAIIQMYNGTGSSVVDIKTRVNAWIKEQSDSGDGGSASAPADHGAFEDVASVESGESSKQRAVSESSFVPFAENVNYTIGAFVNRIRSNQMRGRSVMEDGMVRTMFLSLTDANLELMKHFTELNDRRGYFESVQDKLAEILDAREAIDALREEHNQQQSAELMELQRQRQLQMFAKLGVMRQKKHEMLEQQRQLVLQRMGEEQRRMELQKQLQQRAVPQQPVPEMYYSPYQMQQMKTSSSSMIPQQQCQPEATAISSIPPSQQSAYQSQRWQYYNTAPVVYYPALPNQVPQCSSVLQPQIVWSVPMGYPGAEMFSRNNEQQPEEDEFDRG